MGIRSPIERGRAAMLKIRPLFPTTAEGRLHAGIIERSVMDIAGHAATVARNDARLVKWRFKRAIAKQGGLGWVRASDAISHLERGTVNANRHRLEAARHLARNIYSAELCGVDSDHIRRVLAMAGLAFQDTEKKIRQRKRRLFDMREIAAQRRQRQACL